LPQSARGNKRCRGMARNLLKAWPALWTFADHDAPEPTNNHAERSLRGGVIYRKLSLGTQSESGERSHRAPTLGAHNMPTAAALAIRLPTDALSASARGDPTPLLT
jgi:transposase